MREEDLVFPTVIERYHTLNATDILAQIATKLEGTTHAGLKAHLSFIHTHLEIILTYLDKSSLPQEVKEESKSKDKKKKKSKAKKAADQRKVDTLTLS
jgi:hypothetical protein